MSLALLLLWWLGVETTACGTRGVYQEESRAAHFVHAATRSVVLRCCENSCLCSVWDVMVPPIVLESAGYLLLRIKLAVWLVSKGDELVPALAANYVSCRDPTRRLIPLSPVIFHQRSSQWQFIIAPSLSSLSLSFAFPLPPPPALCFHRLNNPSCESASELLLPGLKIPAPWQWSATCLPASYLIY